MKPSTLQIETDVVVIGGGIQGLWLLADLIERGYQALALERLQPGGGQTGHSHLFLHRGHMHGLPRTGEGIDEAPNRMRVFRDAHERWIHELSAGRLQEARPTPLQGPFYVGWKLEDQRTESFSIACQDAEIDCTPMESLPPWFPNCSSLFEAEGVCLESNKVLKSLLNYRDLRDRISHCESIGLVSDTKNPLRLVVQMRPKPGRGKMPAASRREEIELRCRGLVLAAGTGNDQWLSKTLPDSGIRFSQARQQTVKTFMLVVKDPAGQLPRLCGFFPGHGGIFIAHRQAADGGMIWLVADKQRNHVRVPGQWTELDARGWFRNIQQELKQLLPWLFEDPKQYRWGIYEAAKAECWTASNRQREGGVLPDKHGVFKHPECNVWVTWPSFFTLAPTAADEIARQIAESDITASSQIVNRETWDEMRTSLAPAGDQWKTTPLLGWEDFESCYG